MGAADTRDTPAAPGFSSPQRDLMSMVFCRGCGKEIHDTANACPHCGAPQGIVSRPGQNSATLPSISTNNTLVWILAFAPIIGSILEYILAYLVHGNEYRAQIALSKGYYFWVTLILNIVLSVLDEKNLQKSNIDTAPFGSAFLVPVYLFKRAKVLNQNKAYFIVWIACFAVALIS